MKRTALIIPSFAQTLFLLELVGPAASMSEVALLVCVPLVTPKIKRLDYKL